MEITVEHVVHSKIKKTSDDAAANPELNDNGSVNLLQFQLILLVPLQDFKLHE